ncbi:ABC transporter permease [Litorilinea aerophila]|uniref:ABC transporter permease n=1 Tax=Litorilinea aerophila TaxID=1204385 RepID=UPI001E2A9CC1|nr:ABC transporter permease [Litorilinea aerophila]MCC9076287.1 ABC transporter permease [Litorilinea aerophila]
MTETARQPDLHDESYYLASQWQLVWRKFRKHRLALLGMSILVIFYLVAIFADFFALHPYQERNADFALAPPQRIHFWDESGQFHFPPFIYGRQQSLDMRTLQRTYVEDTEVRYPLRFFARGYSYKLLGLLETDIHLIGVDGPVKFFPFGTDEFGRDLYSRNIFASRISLSIGFVGVLVSFVIGCLVGGISGYFGGTVDLIIQRLIEFIISIPTIPLWIALAAALPPHWTSVQVYFSITVVLATVGWTGLARTVRGKLLETREADFVMAARVSNVGDFHIIVRHLLPSFASYLIVSLTLGVPGMILGETALSFLGIGIRPPAVSWGVLLQDAQNIRSLAQSPWLFIPAVFVVVAVLCFNFVGDGLRDAADPYK